MCHVSQQSLLVQVLPFGAFVSLRSDVMGHADGTFDCLGDLCA
jgi:hypothetical protein